MNHYLKVFFIILVLGTAGCSKQIHDDYAVYLQNNANTNIFMPTQLPFTYSLSPETKLHTLTVQAWMAGPLNTWIVRFSEILLANMRSHDVRKSLPNVVEASPQPGTNSIFFHLVQYDFKNTKATIRLEITTRFADGSFQTKLYGAEGQAQRGKMYWGGPFAMKNAMQQSTKMAMDKILKYYTNDLALFVHKKDMTR